MDENNLDLIDEDFIDFELNGLSAPHNSSFHLETIDTHINLTIKGADTVDLKVIALFHDLGKVDATKWNGETWTAGGHEIISTDIVWCFKNWIIEMGGDVEIVSFIVKNHMRIKYLSDFKMSKKLNL